MTGGDLFATIFAISLVISTASNDCLLNDALILYDSEGQPRCACQRGYSCEYQTIRNKSPPCAHANMEHQGQLYDIVPAECSNCTCKPGKVLLPRIIFATMPRSGNGWARDMIELAGKRATESVFHETFAAYETDANSSRHIYTTARNPATNLFSHACGHSHQCGEVHPSTDGVTIAKTHSPFIVNGTKGGAGVTHHLTDAGVGAFLLLAVRNPLDNWEAWIRWLNGKKRFVEAEYWTLERFIEAWTEFHSFWQDTLPFALVPRFVYRFEDLNEFERRVSIVHQYIKRSSSVTGLTLTPQQVRVAVSNPQVMPMMKTNADTALLLRGHERYSAANITYAVRHCFKHLERFGYLQLYKGWLRLHDMQILQSQLQKYVDVFSNTYYPPNP